MFTNSKKYIAAAASSLVIVGTGIAHAGAGDVDPAFGSDGKIEFIGAVIPMSDGRIAVANSVAAGLEVRMLDENGQIEPTYGDSGVARVPLTYAGLYESVDHGSGTAGVDGSLVFRGEIVGPDTAGTLWALVKLDPTGHPDPTFGADGDGIVFIGDLPSELNTVSGFALQQDGAVLVSGGFQGYDYCGDTGGVLRLLPNGAVDVGFGTNGWALIDDVDICGLEIVGLRTDASIVVTTNHGRFWVLESNGAPETSFGTNGRQVDDVPALSDSLLLPDDGLMLVGLSEGGARLVRLTATGQRDGQFGSNGTLDIHLGKLAFDRNDAVEEFPRLRLSTDGQSVLLQDHIHTIGAPTTNCTAVARLGLDGTLDTSFGHNGISCLVSAPYLRLSVQGTGHPLLSNDDTMIRLLLDEESSPGFIGVLSDTFVNESAGTATITVSRSGGKDGAVSVDYNTVAGTAIAGGDYTTASGRLEWANGEDGDRTITLSINNDTDSEGSSLSATNEEEFSVEFVSSGSPMLTTATRVVILDNDPPTAQPASSGSGGGGSMSWFTLLMLLACAGWGAAARSRRRREFSSRVAASTVTEKRLVYRGRVGAASSPPWR